jgi:hypothetical protein
MPLLDDHLKIAGRGQGRNKQSSITGSMMIKQKCGNSITEQKFTQTLNLFGKNGEKRQSMNLCFT